MLLMGIALIMLMAGFIKICSVHTPSSNPKLPPPKPLPGTPHPVFGDLQYPVMPSMAPGPTEESGVLTTQLIPIHLRLLFFLRYTEEETAAAGEPAGAGPTTLSPTQRELPDGTDETLRDIASLLSCAFKGSTSLQRVTFTTYCKSHRTYYRIYFTGQSPKFFSEAGA